MLRNYLRVGWRNLWKSKLISAVNVIGLAVGMSVCLLILTVIHDQDRRDEHHPHAERIHRVTSSTEQLGQYASSPGPLGPAIERSVPGVEQAVRIRQEELQLSKETNLFSSNVLYVGTSFLSVFDFPLAKGRPDRALEDPFSIVISSQTARRLFGREEALGQTVTVQATSLGDSTRSQQVFTVTGVLEETGAQSHLAADAYLSFPTLTSPQTNASPSNWASEEAGSIFFNYYTYLLLEEGASPSAVEAAINRVAQPHSNRELYDYALGLQPLTAIHLGTGLQNELAQSGVIEAAWVYIMAGLGLLVLLAAGFNYANLSVARSLRRAQEVGVRKSLGARRDQVAVQFLGESVLTALLALLLALALLYGLLPFFNSLQFAEIFRVQISLSDVLRPGVLVTFVVFAVVVGLLAGVYPALYLSRFDPVEVLRRAGSGGGSGSSAFSARKGLTALQLGTALCLIISAALLYQQASHLTRADYGFETSDLAYVNLRDMPPQAFKQQALQLTSVESAALTSSLPIVSGLMRGDTLRRTTGQAGRAGGGVRAQTYWVEPDYFETMGLSMLAGGEDATSALTARSAAIVNERAVRALGLRSPSALIGDLIRFGDRPLRVVGVVENYSYNGPIRELDPLVLQYDPGRFEYALVRSRPGRASDVVTDLEAAGAKLGSSDPGNYGRLDASIARITVPMVETARVIGLTALLTVLIACLGLLGMATYNVRTRTREIGIRKALGAAAHDIAWLLSREYVWLMVGASAFAVPLSYLLNRQWLATFAHRIEIGWMIPALSMVSLLVLAVGVVAMQTVRAALTNPADTLRYDGG